MGIVEVAEVQLELVYGGRSLWETIKAAGKWAKDHIVIGMRSIGFKGRF